MIRRAPGTIHGWVELFKDDQWVILNNNGGGWPSDKQFLVAHRDERRCPHWTHSYDQGECWKCGDGFSKFIKNMMVFLDWQGK